jgi:hypothetical protein
VLEVEANLLVGPIVDGVRPPHLGGDVLQPGARGVVGAASLLGGGAPARVQGAPGGEGLAQPEHQHLRLVEGVGPLEGDAPLLVLRFQIGQPVGGLAARLGGAGPGPVLRDVGVSFQRDAQDGVQAGGAGQLGVVRGGAGLPRGQESQ